MIESRMNRTITESRHVAKLIDRMKGQFAYDPHKASRLEIGQERPEQKPSEKPMKEEQGRPKWSVDKNGCLNL
jgi:hypothetical protein